MKSQFKTPTSKKQHSIYDIKQTGDCSSIKRAKLFGELKKDYLNRMRDLYHQTDHLANYTDLSVFNEPLEHTPKGTFLGKISPNKYISSRKYCTPKKDAEPAEVSELEASAEIDDNQVNNTNEISTSTPMKGDDNEIVENTDEVTQQNSELKENQIDDLANEEEQNVEQEAEEIYQVEEEEEEEEILEVTLSQKDQELIDDVVNSVLDDDENNLSLIIAEDEEEEEEEFIELVVNTNEGDAGYSLEASN